MSTHASIGILDTSGRVRAIDVHFDGDQVGKRLVKHHRTRWAAEAILELGNLASLGDSLDSLPPVPPIVTIREFMATHPEATDAEIEARNAKRGMRPYGEYTVACARDQGETMEENAPRRYALAKDWLRETDASYHYLWIADINAPREGRNPGWYVALPGGGKPTFVPVGQMVTVA